MAVNRGITLIPLHFARSKNSRMKADEKSAHIHIVVRKMNILTKLIEFKF